MQCGRRTLHQPQGLKGRAIRAKEKHLNGGVDTEQEEDRTSGRRWLFYFFFFLISSDSASIRVEVMFIIATRQCSRVASSTLERRGLEATAGAGAEGQTF